jgi:gliding motility-associated-like protein
MKVKKDILSFIIKTFITVLIFSTVNITYAQNVINNGTHIVVKPGAYLVISKSYINRNDGNSDGIVDLDGTIILRKNWVNEANNNVVSNIGSSPMGNVIMDGTDVQYIEGVTPTHFENLILRNSEKILHNTNNEVNGRLTLDAILELNSNKIIIDNASTDAITYVSKYIHSETSPDDGYGEVQWNIGDKTDTYQVPFGSGLSFANDLNLTLTTSVAGNAGGAISFATYPSGCHNVPLPTYVQALDRPEEYIADRFWIIDPLYNFNKPDISIKFKYINSDVDVNCNARIDKSTLKAIRYSTLKNQWTDMPPNGNADQATNMVSTSVITASDFYAPWTLVNENIDFEIFIPNAFTPNGDGVNDFFIPEGFNLELNSINMYIFDRWGKTIFSTEDFSKPWNGTFSSNSKKCEEGVYAYLIYITDMFGEQHKYVGHVTLVQ